MNKSRMFYLIPILVLVLISVVSAQTLVAGKIYDSDYSNNIAGADVKIICNGYTWNTVSVDDGTYAVRFKETECNDKDLVDVTASKSGFSEKTDSGVVSKCDSGDCGGKYFTIINLGLESSSSSNGGSREDDGSGGHYSCGDGYCNLGENVNNCPSDCDVKETTESETESIETVEETETIEPEEETQQIGFSKITGAVTGTMGTAGTYLIGIFLILLIVTGITVKILKRR